MAGNVPKLVIKPRRFYKTPCQDCEDRVVGCHANCDRYKAYKQDGLDDWKKRVSVYRGEAQAVSFLMKAKVETVDKNRKAKWMR